MAVGVKAPAPARLRRAGRPPRRALSTPGSREAEAAPAAGQKLRAALGRLYRSKGERYQVADYYTADFTLDVGRRGPGAGRLTRPPTSPRIDLESRDRTDATTATAS